MSSLGMRLNRLQHVSDESISRLIAGESSPLADLRASRHMARCWQCRARREAMERAAMRITEHRRIMADRITPDPERRAALLAALRSRAQRVDYPPPATKSLFDISVNPGHPMNPLFASFAIVLIATLLLFWIWQRPKATVSAGQLMLGAQMAEQKVAEGKAAVVYQKIHIVTAHTSIEREIYRDARGVRRPRSQALHTEASQVRSLFDQMNVDWDNPLSAASFRAWHDRQQGGVDRVIRRDGNLLTLETTVPRSRIEAESFTVRADDFHPVARTIRTGDNTIQVAELNYAVLDWSGVNDALFEPLPSSPGSSRPVLHAIAPPSLPSAMMLDNAELAARLELNHLQADQGEQIAINRNDREVQVKGIVETSARKQEIARALGKIPLLQVELLSIAELQQQPADNTTTKSVRMQSVDVAESPLQLYLTSTGQAPAAQQEIARALLDAALQMKQSAAALETLQHRFAAMTRSSATDSAYAQLYASDSQRLLAALDHQETALRRLGFPAQAVPEKETANDSLLSPDIDRNQSLCRELIAGNAGDPQRSAQQIIPDLVHSIARIRTVISVEQHP
jgi:hypothetical protein